MRALVAAELKSRPGSGKICFSAYGYQSYKDLIAEMHEKITIIMKAAFSKAELESDIASRFGDAFKIHEKTVVETLSTGIDGD